MPKKFTDKELERLVQDLTADNRDSNFAFEFLGSSKKQRKSLKTPIEKLSSYNLIVEHSVFWASRQAYLELIQSFLLKKIDAETLTSKFFELRTQDIISVEELRLRIEDQILPIPDLYYTFKATDFTSAIDDLYLEIDRYSSDLDDSNLDDIVYSENKLRLLIQKKFVLKLQHFCDLNDSFFQSQVDLDQLIRKSYLIFMISTLGLFTSLLVPIS